MDESINLKLNTHLQVYYLKFKKKLKMEFKTTKIINTNHEKPMLFVDDYLYYKNQVRPNGNLYWRCKEYFSSCKCQASITTTGLNTEIVSLSKKGHTNDHQKVNELNIQILGM
ncbi:hypothetical protein BpHYR1_021326 [Brachionus plicatilis]|uniref:FLYWCH-type domain-containing protein n=1 Tax=Brachionus plicatilis TaxID=10195 RepID=A0A3M7QUU2_BRAPC|nr:hypothetical protein BpHYR1_021326 [Brachionus plicatilis]